MAFAKGTDDVATAPVIGFGTSTPTPNSTLRPASYEEQHLETAPGYYDPPYQSAWWKFVAPHDGWVCFDLHKSSSNYSTHADGDTRPYTQLAAYIGEPGNLWCLQVTNSSVPIGDDSPTYTEQYGVDWNVVPTSEIIIKVDAGWTYFIQAGMWDLNTAYDPDALTNYVLTVREVVCHATELVLPTVGPIYNSPDGHTVSVNIVGGDDALKKDSTGYVDFPAIGDGATLEGSRYGAWMQPAVSHPNWPPPPNARHPGNWRMGPQHAMRYYVEVLPGNEGRGETGEAWFEGNQGGVKQYLMSTTPFPDLGGPYIWDPSEPNNDTGKVPATTGTWKRDGGWETLYDGNTFIGYERGPNVQDRGVVQGVHLSPTEEFLADGEFRPVQIWNPNDDPITACAKWYRWYGEWGMPPFYNPVYQADQVTVDPPDYSVWFQTTATGYTLANGIEFAQAGWGLRIHWVEWIIRWVTFEVKKGVLTGGPSGDRRAFSDH